MPPPPAPLYTADEELGKRDDDFRPARSSSSSSTNTLAATLRQPWRWRKRRILALAALALLVYVFVKNIPEPLGPAEQRLGYGLRPGQVPHQAQQQRGGGGYYDSGGGGGFSGGGVGGDWTAPAGGPPRTNSEADEVEAEQRQHYYDGPIKYYRLAPTLHAIARTMGARRENRNVLFAASSLRSAANLLPMACAMARWDRNYVHLALFGRESLSLQEVLEVNGVGGDGEGEGEGRGDCPVYFHDARPDYGEWSSEARAEAAVRGALKHVWEFMHPQAMIVDDAAAEEGFHTRAVRRRGRDFDTAVIEVPAGRYEDFLWLTRLDAGSLSHWHDPSIEILVQAPSGGGGGGRSSGSLLRLLKSLSSASYAGLKPPRLTIDLPPEIDPPLQHYLSTLTWPPRSPPTDADPPGTPHQSTLTLHHRIPTTHLTPTTASLRLLESFYPPSPSTHHVLLLSPQAELSPLYLHYLHYLLLEYHYSSYPPPGSDALLGLSLDVPTAWLNGSTHDFALPTTADMRSRKYATQAAEPGGAEDAQPAPAPFLYQAPSSTATLLFGTKWTAFHAFLARRLTAQAPPREKLVSAAQPGWTEYLLELMRAKGWSVLHPAEPFVTVHEDLARVPEEFEEEVEGLRERRGDDEDDEDDDDARGSPQDEPFFLAHPSSKKNKNQNPGAPLLPPHLERDPPSPHQPLHAVLPFAADLPELPHLPSLTYAGVPALPAEMRAAREDFAREFRTGVGGCGGEVAERRGRREGRGREGEVGDLFCGFGGDDDGEIEEEEGMEEEDEEVAKGVVEETGGFGGAGAGGGGGPPDPMGGL